MAFTITHTSHLFANPSYHPAIHFPELPLKQRKITRHHCLPPKSQPSEDVPSTADHDRRQQKLLQAVAESNEEQLPGVRTFENDSARLTLVGAVDFQQAVTAAAADGGRAANEHIIAGLPTMVIETVFPGRPDDCSTLSTRLFLPASKVKEKAKKLKATLSEDILSSTTSANILAMTFRQVVLQQLWSFELVAFRCGTERNIDDFGNLREVPHDTDGLSSYFPTSSIESHTVGQSFGRASAKFIQWFHKPKRYVSKDSSIILHKLLDNEIAANAKILLDKFSSRRVKSMGIKSKYSWWTLSSDPELEKFNGPEFTAGLNEHIPSYRLQIDAGKFKDVKIEGGNLFATNIWEILLTHCQMVCLADILDIYYQDDFTLPAKQLSCDAMMNLSNLPTNKSGSSLLKILSATLAGGLLLVMISILSQLYLPNLTRWRKYHKDHSVQSSCIRCIEPESLGLTQLEACCIAVIRKLKDSFGWPGEIITKAGHCAWTGELPLYLKRMVEIDSKTSDVLSTVTLPGERIEEMKGSVQDIASYQVVLSTEGEVVGFQPRSRMAVNHWASNPLTKELYARRNLSPGFLEPGLKIHHPSDVVLLELLMSANPEPHFALVRPAGI
ncbi:uncharacterized protein [Coffea arabica]|uniref:Uncharacterized protein isoform X3 n=1 Tax=Coffea arabica TaxID=13443 RepID=A0ABM4UHT3_COFAR